MEEYRSIEPDNNKEEVKKDIPQKSEFESVEDDIFNGEYEEVGMIAPAKRKLELRKERKMSDFWEINFWGENRLSELKKRRRSSLTNVQKIQLIILDRILNEGPMDEIELYNLVNNELSGVEAFDFELAMKELKDNNQLIISVDKGLAYKAIDPNTKLYSDEEELHKFAESVSFSFDPGDFMPLLSEVPLSKYDLEKMKKSASEKYGEIEWIEDWGDIKVGDIISRTRNVPNGPYVHTMYTPYDVSFEVLEVEHVKKDERHDMYFITGKLLESSTDLPPKGATHIFDANRAIINEYEFFRILGGEESVEPDKSEEKNYWGFVIGCMVREKPDITFGEIVAYYKSKMGLTLDEEAIEFIEDVVSEDSHRERTREKVQNVKTLDELYEALSSESTLWYQCEDYRPQEAFMSTDKLINDIQKLKKDYDDVIEYYYAEDKSNMEKPEAYDYVMHGDHKYGEEISSRVTNYKPEHNRGLIYRILENRTFTNEEDLILGLNSVSPEIQRRIQGDIDWY